MSLGEIRYRALTTEQPKEWVVGSRYVCLDRIYLNRFFELLMYGRLDEETLSVYTGFTDKGNISVYTGDYLKYEKRVWEVVKRGGCLFLQAMDNGDLEDIDAVELAYIIDNKFKPLNVVNKKGTKIYIFNAYTKVNTGVYFISNFNKLPPYIEFHKLINGEIGVIRYGINEVEIKGKRIAKIDVPIPKDYMGGNVKDKTINFMEIQYGVQQTLLNYD